MELPVEGCLVRQHPVNIVEEVVASYGAFAVALMGGSVGLAGKESATNRIWYMQW